MAVPKRFKFKTKKLQFKSINNNQTYILSLNNKKILNKVKKYLYDF
jgi:hypothetical protein